MSQEDGSSGEGKTSILRTIQNIFFGKYLFGYIVYFALFFAFRTHLDQQGLIWFSGLMTIFMLLLRIVDWLYTGDHRRAVWALLATGVVFVYTLDKNIQNLGYLLIAVFCFVFFGGSILSAVFRVVNGLEQFAAGKYVQGIAFAFFMFGGITYQRFWWTFGFAILCYLIQIGLPLLYIAFGSRASFESQNEETRPKSTPLDRGTMNASLITHAYWYGRLLVIVLSQIMV